jgi:hypothetical protein
VKALLMHRDRDFALQARLPWNDRAVVKDLELEALLQAMAGEDSFVREAALKALLTSWDNDPETVLYRQAVVRDGLHNPSVLRALYALVVETIEARRKHYVGTWGPSSVLYGARDLMQMFVGMLRRLRDLVRAPGGRFESEGFRTLFALLERELTDEYLARIEAHLVEVRFRAGVLISAAPGPGNVGSRFVLRQPHEDKRSWLRRHLVRGGPSYTFRLADRDEAGGRILSEMRDRGIHLVANALAQSADHIDGFFQMLRAELAFHVGCLNLHEHLVALGAPTSFPEPLPTGQRRLRCHGLYDPCLALQKQGALVGNGFDADGKSLVVITGANQGGKSTFLRAVGVAQLMMQSGMFVAAESFEGELCSGLITHYKREEDATLKSGKFDEELVRISEIVEHLAPGTMMLFNESFSATNEREGSEIARQVVSALLEKGIKVFFVTHLHAFARGMFARALENALFLRAERLPDGTRTFRLVEGEPLATSHGKDLYRRIFAASA